ncbi:MAG: hypothetical protein ACFCBU_02160 [Cyanophyceae cyanobacterium]
MEAPMAIAPNGNPDKNGKKNGQKNSRKNGKKPGLKDPKVQGTVWVGDATACLTQACQWLKTQENNRYAVITPSPQAARSLGVSSRSLDQWAALTLPPLHTGSVTVTHRLVRAAVGQYWDKTTDLAATAQRILPTIRQYFRGGLDLEKLRNCKTVSTRARQIAQFAIAYRAALRSRNLIDEAELFNFVTAKLDRNFDKKLGENTSGLSGPPPTLIYGYPWATVDEARFIAAAAPAGSGVCLDAAATGAIALFQESGWDIVNLAETASLTQITPQAYSFANGGAEVRWAMGQVKQWLMEGVPPRHIALVARDERTYGEWLGDVAWDYETPVRLLFSIPLAATRVGGWVRDLLEAATSNFPFETTAKILRHPLCGYGVVVDPTLAEGASTGETVEKTVEKTAEETANKAKARKAINDNAENNDNPENNDEAAKSAGARDDWWHLARRRHPEGLDAWAAIGIDLKTWLEPGAAKQSRGDWVSWLDEVIFNAKVRSRAQTCPRETSAINALKNQLAALERFQEGDPTPQAQAQSKAKSKAPNKSKNQALNNLTLTQFAEEIRDVLSLTTVPAEPGRAGVELHQPRAMVGSRYEHVIILGAMEGTLPEPIVNDPVVDFYDRKRLTRAGFPLDSAATLARRVW